MWLLLIVMYATAGTHMSGNIKKMENHLFDTYRECANAVNSGVHKVAEGERAMSYSVMCVPYHGEN